MYWNSPQRLQRMNYCNGVHDFINYATSIPRNISWGDIRCPWKGCKNNKKEFINPDIIIMHLLHKRFMEEYLCWYAHEEPFVPHEIMVERIAESTSSAINMHRVETNNSNPYRLWMWLQWIKVMPVNVQS